MHKGYTCITTRLRSLLAVFLIKKYEIHKVVVGTLKNRVLWLASEVVKLACRFCEPCAIWRPEIAYARHPIDQGKCRIYKVDLRNERNAWMWLGGVLWEERYRLVHHMKRRHVKSLMIYGELSITLIRIQYHYFYFQSCKYADSFYTSHLIYLVIQIVPNHASIPNSIMPCLPNLIHPNAPAKSLLSTPYIYPTPASYLSCFLLLPAPPTPISVTALLGLPNTISNSPLLSALSVTGLAGLQHQGLGTAYIENLKVRN